MTATVLRLERVRDGDLDAAVWALGTARLERRRDGLFIACDVEPDVVAGVLARAGLRACPGTTADLDPRLAAAVVRDLDPRGPAEVVDRVTVRSIRQGEATWRLRPFSGRFAWRGSRYARDAVRAVLRDEDRMLAWTRLIWARPSLLRSGSMTGVRPVVFDRGSLDHPAPRFGFVREGRLARWVNG